MSCTSVNREEKTKKDITWSHLIADSDAQIKAMSTRIKKLRKSIVFFKKQEASGVPFPVPEENRHKEFS